jgi:prepilin-type N-terminal cleavage/methylation domain-containing protein
MRNRRGVSLIEVMVALVLFGIIVTVHTVATMRYGMNERIVALGAARSAAVAMSIDIYSAMARGDIAASAGCSDITLFPNYLHERCVSVAAVSGTITRVTIVITPENAALRADTVFVDRVTSNTTPPFN